MAENRTWADKIGNAFSTLWSYSTVGVVFDLALSPWDDESRFDEALKAIKQSDPNAGGLSAGARAFKDAYTPASLGEVLHGFDDLYSAGVSRPMSTFATATSLASRPGHTGAANAFGFGDLLDGDTWTQAWNIAEHRSPGQSIYLGFATRDILDEEEVREAQETTRYKVLSGVLDAAARWNWDPLNPAGRAIGAGRKALFVRHASDAPGGAAAYVVSDDAGNFVKWAIGRRAAEIAEHPAVRESDNP